MFIAGEVKEKKALTVALDYMERAAKAKESPSTEAMNLLGSIYNGKSFAGVVPKDDHKAIHWFIKAFVLDKLDTDHYAYLCMQNVPEFGNLPTNERQLWRMAQFCNEQIDKCNVEKTEAEYQFYTKSLGSIHQQIHTLVKQRQFLDILNA